MLGKDGRRGGRNVDGETCEKKIMMASFTPQQKSLSLQHEGGGQSPQMTNPAKRVWW